MLLLSILFLTVLTNSYLIYQYEKYAETKIQWIAFTHEVIILTQNFLEEMQNAQRGERGYLLTQNIDYLEPYYEGVKYAHTFYERLHSKTLHNYEQTQKLEQVKILMEKNLAVYKRTIDVAQNESFSKAIDIVKQNTGKEMMDAIRVILRDYINEENILLEQRKGEFLAHRTQIMTLLLGGMLFFIIIAIFTYLFLEKTLFSPMNILLRSTHKMEKGEEIDVKDILLNNEMGYLLASFYNMHEKVFQREKNLIHTATHDSLTGLLNRLEVDDTLDNAIEKSKKEQKFLAVFFIDINKFKVINDTLGHEVGDTVLKEVASRLENILRSSDSIFRIGGDEFLILLEFKNESTIKKVINKILLAMQTPIISAENTLDVSLSIGVARYPQDAATSSELVKNADIAMYIAKNDSLDDYKIFNSSMLKRFNDQ